MRIKGSAGKNRLDNARKPRSIGFSPGILSAMEYSSERFSATQSNICQGIMLLYFDSEGDYLPEATRKLISKELTEWNKK